MPISKTDRIARKLSHTKQERLQISNGVPSVNDLRTGVPVVRSTPEGVVEYTRYNNALYKKVLDRAEIVRRPPVVRDTGIDTIPVFQAYRSGSAQSNIAAGGEVLLQFNSSEIDTRSGYNTSTFLYTVSEKGIYSLHYNLTFQQFDVDMTYAVTYMKDSVGNRFAIHKIDGEEFTDTSGQVSHTAHIIRELDVGETIGVYYYQSGGADQVDLGQFINSITPVESVFGGYMITDVKSVRALASAEGDGDGIGDTPSTE
jgi:hypothetical protein